MRRPHPRFDDARNAWVTRAGGQLKILAKGPKTADTETAAWDAFYVHMAKLGEPVEAAALPQITLGELCDRYGEWLKREVGAARLQLRTLEYYHDHLQRFLDAVERLPIFLAKQRADDAPLKRLNRENLELICFEYVSG